LKSELVRTTRDGKLRGKRRVVETNYGQITSRDQVASSRRAHQPDGEEVIDRKNGGWTIWTTV
jgi:hypothetical protein